MSKKTVEVICATGNDYLLVLKRNQKALFEEVAKVFEEKEQVEGMEKMKEAGEYYEEKEEGKGEIVVRKCTVIRYENKEWRGLKTVVKMEKEVIKKGGEKKRGRRRKYKKEVKREEKVQYLISSREIGSEYNARYFMRLKRKHWGIEVFHYVKDVVYGEDDNNSEVAVIDGLINSIIYNIMGGDFTKKKREFSNKPLKLNKEYGLIKTQ